MSTILIAVSSVVAVGVAGYFLIPMIARGRQGYKEDREKAQKEAEKAAKAKAYAQEQDRQELFNKEFLTMFDEVLRHPERFTRTVSMHGNQSKYPYITSLIELFRNYEQTLRINRDQSERITSMQQTIREIRKEIKEVHQAVSTFNGAPY